MVFLIIIVLLAGIILLGPKPPKLRAPLTLPDLTSELESIEAKITQKQSATRRIKPDNHSQMLWADVTNKQQTPICVLYLHGFSASPMEGGDLATELAERYGANIYLPLLEGHGLQEEEPLLELTAEKLQASAFEAFAIAKKLGVKVLIVGTSTGATFGLLMASIFPEVCGLILYSPNVRLADKKSALLGMPWGLPLAQRVLGSKYYEFEPTDYSRQYWTSKYRLEALVELQRILLAHMHQKTFSKVKVPVFIGYYFKDKNHQDTSVSVPAVLKMYEQLGTPAHQKRKIAFPDANEHVIANPVLSGAYEAVKAETFRFVEEVLEWEVRK